MPNELIYTSAPRGLKPGSTGYCTVAHTPDLPKDLAEQLEGISHYRHLRVDDPSANPPAFAHSILTTGYYVHHVLSRVADSGLDHSGRSNFLAHHVVFDPDHLPDGGPAWLCEQRLFIQKWDGNARLIPGDRAIPAGHSEPRVCTKWQRLTGDAGWGGALASATNAAEPAYIIYEPGQDVLGLLVEAMALLPHEARWNITFNTYFTGKAVRTTCQWRCVTADSAEARDAIASRRGLVIRLDEPMSGSPSGALVEAARTGEVERPVSRRKPAPASTVRTSRPPEPEDLPEPIVPASRPIRSRPPEPVAELEDSQYELPTAERSSRSPGKGVGPLLLGILLGGLLLLAFTSLLELAAGKSMLRLVNVPNSDVEMFEKLKKEKEAAESDAANRIGELKRERDSAENAKADLRNELIRLRDELTGLRKQLAEAQAELKKPKEQPAPAVKGGGFFLTARDQVREFDRQQKLKAANERAEGLQNQIDMLIAKLAAAANRPLAPSLPVVRLDKAQLGGQQAVDLFKLKLQANAKPTLDVFGLPADIKLTPLGDGGDRVMLRSPDTGFEATLSVGNDGVVRISDGKNMDKHPYLGLAVIRVSPGGSDPTAYRQLFWPVATSAGGLNAELPKGEKMEGRNRRYHYTFAPRLGGASLRAEVALIKGANQFMGRSARIAVAGKTFELEPGLDPFVIENRPLEGDPVLKLRVENGEVVIDATFADAASAADRVSIEAIEIVRLLSDDKARNFPGYSQEVLRVYPK